jgi:hypothetical protein
MVVGPGVYWVKEDYTWQRLGTVSNLANRVYMVDDGFGLVIADGSNLYRLDMSTLFFTGTGFLLTDPTQVAFLNRRTIVIGQTGSTPQNTFFYSGLYDNSSWDALDYASAESSADPITGIVANEGNLYLFGPKSFEVWTPSEDVDLPFTRSYASSGTVGLYSSSSLVKTGGAVYFIGSNQGAVGAYAVVGSQATKISTVPLEQEWQATNVSDASAWVVSHDGHDFVVFNFDVLDKTYVYDIGEKTWHERATRDEITDTLHRWYPQYGVSTLDATLCGARYSNKLFLLSKEYATEDGKNIVRTRTTSHQNAEQKVIKINAVRFDLEQGTGITREDPSRYTQAATVMFRYSYDRGRTWSSELRQTIGRTGDYQKTIEFTRLGASRNFTVEFKISDAAKTSILNGWIYPEVGSRGRA